MAVSKALMKDLIDVPCTATILGKDG